MEEAFYRFLHFKKWIPIVNSFPPGIRVLYAEWFIQIFLSNIVPEYLNQVLYKPFSCFFVCLVSIFFAHDRKQR